VGFFVFIFILYLVFDMGSGAPKKDMVFNTNQTPIDTPVSRKKKTSVIQDEFEQGKEFEITPPDSAERDQLIDKIAVQDVYFSLPLFLDYARTLYTEALLAAGRNELEKLNAYINRSLFPKLYGYYGMFANVKEIIIGNCAVMDAKVDNAGASSITLLFETGYTVEYPRTYTTSACSEKSLWVLTLKKGIHSRGPGENKVACPQCGESLEGSVKGKCSSCNASFELGAGGWYLKSILEMSREFQAPGISTDYPEEQGTEAPTVFHPELKARLAEFKKNCPGFSETAFYEEVEKVFTGLQSAWSSQDVKALRDMETASLFQTHLHWIKNYKNQDVRNVLKSIQVKGVELVKIRQDSFYDALTVRIHASMIDYMESTDGELLGGDKSKPRPFSEYWTFIRRIEEGNEKLSWLLGMIEQDDNYTG
jgi:predicted lipid-binding transport protein (Tim44 family)